MKILLFCPQENVGRRLVCDVLMGSWGPGHGGGREMGTGSGLDPFSSVASASFVGGICSRGAPSCVEPCNIDLSDLAVISTISVKNVVCYNFSPQSPLVLRAVLCIVGQRMAPF